MAWIIYTPNPFEPMQMEKSEVPAGMRLWEWVKAHFPSTMEFPTPTICIRNGQALLRKEWDYAVQERDVINFIAVQGVTAMIIIAIVLAVASIAMALLMPVPSTNSNNPDSDPVYSVKGKSNGIRLGEPIECNYGRNRIYPSYAARPYYEYIDNDQFQFSLFCLGQGVYDIETIQIGDTIIANYEEVTYEIIQPGGQVTIFPTNVYTSSDAGGQTLYAANQAEVTDDGWVGPFSVNPSGTLTNKIQIDLRYPKGIYQMDEEGNLSEVIMQVRAEYRAIDDAGNPLGAFALLDGTDSHDYWEKSGKTTTPQRQTLSVDVPMGRYQVRLKNVATYRDSPRCGNDVIWDGMRSWIDTTNDFGDVTLLAVKIRASNNLNDATQKEFNVIATRKLPIRESDGTFSAPQPTRSIVWAFVDIFKSLYGGRITDPLFFDWDTLEALDALYSSRSEYFDWTFRDASTVWNAAQTVAQCGRGIPLVAGSLVTMRRDGPLTVPVAMFNHENIKSGSFEWDITLWKLDEKDSIRAEYTEPSTGYKQETVLTTLPGGTTNNPEDVRFEGIQSRAQAYHAALYMLATKRYLRENVVFETGMEGFIPTYGDLIMVSHDVPKWGQSGYVVNAERAEANRYQLWLSEPANFEESGDHQVLLRGGKSEILGPFAAHQTTDPMQVVIDSVEDIDFLLTGKTEPMLFLFGMAGEETKRLRVIRVEPQEGETVRITAVNDAPVIHSFDDLVAPALKENTYAPEIPDLPVIKQLSLAVVDTLSPILQISWSAALGAQGYIVQLSDDGEHWEDVANTVQASLQLPIAMGPYFVRVAAIGKGQGPWITDSVLVSPVRGLTLAAPWTGTSWTVDWWPTAGALGWQVKVYDNTGSEPVLKRTETLAVGVQSFTYDYTTATTDENLVREMIVTVDAVLSLGESSEGSAPSGHPITKVLSNALVEPPAGIVVTRETSEDPDFVNYRVTCTVADPGDGLQVCGWISETDGFDPATVPTTAFNTIMVFPGQLDGAYEATFGVPLDSNGAHPTLYLRMACQDVWGPEILWATPTEAKISSQVAIPAYPEES